MLFIRYITFIFLLLSGLTLHAQSCDLVSLAVTGQNNLDFTFDTFSKYLGGITQNGATRLRVTVDNSINNNPACRWNLVIYIENGNGSTPSTQWESLFTQSSSGDAPTIDLLQINVFNRCNTSLTGNQYFSAPITAGTPIMIIRNDGITVPAGSCVTNVNGPGNPNTNYNEYTFDFDYRLIPGVGLKSGIYQLRLKYVLTEAL